MSETDATHEWRIKSLEAVEKAIQLDIYNERIARENALRELRKDITASYMTRDQMAVAYVSRESIATVRKERREWPIIIAASCSGILAAIDLIKQVTGH